MAIYREDIISIELESGSINRSYLHHTIGSGDQMANRFGVRLFRGGEPVSAESATVTGLFMAPDGTRYVISETSFPGSTGTEGNKAYVQLPPVCYAVTGQFTLAIKLTGGGVEGTMRIIDGTAEETGEDGAVVPTSTIPTTEEIIAAYEEAVSVMGGSVRFDATQSLTSTQKATARGNVEAAGISQVVRVDADQSLTDTEKATARGNVEAAGISQVVRVDADQSLTDTEKATARGNIDAPSNAELNDLGNDIVNSTPVFGNYGYVDSSDGSFEGTGTNRVYCFSKPIRVEKGDVLKYNARGSSAVFVIAAYEEADDNTAIVSKSVAGTNSDIFVSGLYQVPDGVNYVRLCSRTADYDETYLFHAGQSNALPVISSSPVHDFDLFEPSEIPYAIFTYSGGYQNAPVSSELPGILYVHEGIENFIWQIYVQNSTGAVFTRFKRNNSETFEEWHTSAKNKEISILFVGNSLTQDGIAYLPYLLTNYFPFVHFNIYMWYNAGKTLKQQYEDYFATNTPCRIFSIARNKPAWTNYEDSRTMSYILSHYQFDIVCLQEYFNYKTSYTEADLADWTNCRDYIASNYTGGNGLEFISLFHAPLRSNAETVFNRTVAGNNLILQKTIADDMIANGIAVYRALSTSLDNLGDQGHLSNDGTHTQEGLPCLLQTFVTACWLFDRLGLPTSVYGCPMRMTTDIYNTLNVPGPNLGTGVITGTDAENLLAQEVAIKAYKEGKYYVMNNQYVPPQS